MTRARVLFLVLLIFLSACAPVMLGRTPTPAAVGANDVCFAAGFPVLLTPITVCSDPYSDPACPFEGYIGPDYWPRAVPAQIMNAWGVAPDAEVNTTYSLVPPGFRIGGKTLLLESSLFGTLPVAADYGASLYLSNGGLDAGLLTSVPYSGGEV